jgi:hypothetical protein
MGDGTLASFPSGKSELWSGGSSLSTDQPCVSDTGSIFHSIADVLSLCAGWGSGATGPASGFTNSGLSTAVVVGGGDEIASAEVPLSAGYMVPTRVISRSCGCWTC